MTAITWDDAGSRLYESGIDRGVLFLQNGFGVPWNGLVSVSADSGVTVEPVYFDGTKINDLTSSAEFSGTIKAFTYPDEFLQFEGFLEDNSGLIVTGQPSERFHLAYRTMVGSDSEGDSAHYKIHILYDLTAIPTTRTYETMGSTVNPSEFEWQITGIPRQLSGFKPTAYLIVDSRKVSSWFLSDLEEVLYGSDDTDPFLPAMESLAAYIRNYDRIVVIDNGDGTYTVATDQTGAIVENIDGTFEVVNANVTILDADSYEISSDIKDEQLWQP
jgi:hypothetical protein